MTEHGHLRSVGVRLGVGAVQELGVGQLRAGMIVGRTIRAPDQRILLRRGARLDDRLIQLLQARDLGAIWVTTIEDALRSPIEERVRRSALQQLEQIFRLARVAGPPNPVRQTEVERLLQRLLEDVEAILADIAGDSLAERIGLLMDYHRATFDHAVDVGIVAAILARKIHLDLPATRLLTFGALAHDIGKLRVPKAILDKPVAQLTDDEAAVLRQHPIWGAEIIRTWSLGDGVPATVALQHHEYQNGLGYPEGRRGANRIWREPDAQFDPTRIHLAAEIVAVANEFVHLTTPTDDRPALDPNFTVRVLRERAGPRLNRQVVETLLTLVPTFPLGTPVRIIGGAMSGYKGVVVKVYDDDPSRPVVRLLTNAWGERIRPREFDTREAEDAQVRAVLSSAFESFLTGELEP